MGRRRLILFTILLLLLINLSFPAGCEKLTHDSPDAELDIEKFPLYIPKIEKSRDYSMEFFIRIRLSGIGENDTWKMKVWVSENISNRRAATQTWNGTDWIYSYRYAIHGRGNWEGWISLRFCRRYKEYGLLQNNSKCFILVKCAMEKTNLLIYHEVLLLDMDNSTSHGICGGIVTGRIREAGKHLLLMDREGKLVSICRSIGIDNDFSGVTAFYKAYAPAGMELSIMDENGRILKKNITAKRGKFDFRVWVKDGRLWIKNTGDFGETLLIHSGINEVFFLLPGEMVNIRISDNFSERICISVGEEPELGRWVEIPEERNLSIRWVGFDGLDGHEIERGKVYRLRAKVRVYRRIDNVTVHFYLNGKEIGRRVYDRIRGYMICPSVKIDTSNLKKTNTAEIKIVHKDEILRRTIEFRVKESERINLIIVKVFSYDFEWFDGRFIEIFNPNNFSVDISGWYITDKPSKRVDQQPKIIFPEGSVIEKKSSIVITTNSSSYENLFGRQPDFEYRCESPVSNMVEDGRVILNRYGDVVVLKDRFNRTVDAVVYGENRKIEGWRGNAISSPRKGEYLERKEIDNRYIDTNSSSDWLVESLGCTDVGWLNFSGVMEVTAFLLPDCTLNGVIREFEGAKESILINTRHPPDGRMERCLKSKAEAGVKVTILLEGETSCAYRGGYTIPVNGTDIRILMMNSDSGYRRYSCNCGNYVIIDNHTLIVGSSNIWGDAPEYGIKRGRAWMVIVKNSELARFFYDVFRKDARMSDVSEITFSNVSWRDDRDTLSHHSSFPPLHIISNITVTPLLSPDNSERILISLIRSARNSIYIEDDIIDIYGAGKIFRELLNSSKRGVDVRIILNSRCMSRDKKEQVMVLEDYGIDVKFIEPETLGYDSICATGIIIDNSTTVISSANIDSSMHTSRGAGLVIRSREISGYFARAFFHDWNIERHEGKREDYKSKICLLLTLTTTSMIVFRRWRQLRWI
ncbi:MAG: hypothetical protein FE042_06815 [Thermoplasmata archaeon]|nr:MAG: hypothetical protein FE042_06815 [Thermoplasmata archaeon]